MLECYQLNFRKLAIADLVRLLAQRRFRSVDFGIALKDVPWTDPLPTKKEVVQAADEFHAANHHKANYRKPDLTGLMEHLGTGGEDEEGKPWSEYGASPEEDDASNFHHISVSKPIALSLDNMALEEVRALFLNLVRTRYQGQIDDGELSEHEVVVHCLLNSLDFAIDKVAKGSTLCDWEYLEYLDKAWEKYGHRFYRRVSKGNKGAWQYVVYCCLEFLH